MSQAYVAFACGRVRRAPTKQDDIRHEFTIQRQLRAIVVAARQRKLRCIGIRADVSTTAGTRFMARPAFLEAIELARANDALLVIEDLGNIVRHLDAKAATADLTSMAQLDVPVLEAATQQHMSEMDGKTLVARIVLSQLSRKMRADAIEAGVEKPRGAAKASAASRGAAHRRKVLAAQNARRLVPVVRAIEGAMPDSQHLNANRLARELNERGIAAPRGGVWTHGSATRLLASYRRLSKARAETDTRT